MDALKFMNRAFIGGFRPRGEKKAPAKRRIACAPPQKKHRKPKIPKTRKKTTLAKIKTLFHGCHARQNA